MGRHFHKRESIPHVETDCGKRGYRGRASAERAVKSTRYQGMYDADAGLHAYHCQDCGYWHVGHAWRRGPVMEGQRWR